MRRHGSPPKVRQQLLNGICAGTPFRTVVRDLGGARWIQCKRGVVWGWRGPMTNKILLMAGIAAVVVYVIGDLLSALLYHGYSYLDQVISELSAFGSPVRPLMVTVILIHGLLVLAFGVGVSARLP